MKAAKYYLYILKCANESLYTGIATDIERRIDQHNGIQKGGAKYTRVHRPVALAYVECFSSRSEALKREYVIKQLSHTEKEKLTRTLKKSELKKILHASRLH
jgi:putative endonuclease